MKEFPVQKFLTHHSLLSLLIFCTCLFVYLANGQLISSNDSIPNSILAFNWLKSHTLYFDALRNSHYYNPDSLYGANGLPYFLAEAPNGHLTSAYPIGSAIISFPLYVLFFIVLKLTALLHWGGANLSQGLIDLAAADFEPQRQFFEKLAGAILTAFAAVIFYWATRLKFSFAVAIVSTFIYAFATLNWAVSAQGLWVHTVTNLTLISLMFCLFKANRTQGRSQVILLLAAGFLCGLLPGIRPTSLLFAGTIWLYSLVTYRKAALFVVLGSFSFLFNALWNIHFFGLSLKSLVVGGYSRLLGTSSGSYQFGDLSYSLTAFWGLLISPSRGFLIYSPIVFFAIPGIRQTVRQRQHPDEKLLVWLTIASLILFLHYCVYVPWWGAITYGSRFLIDSLPVICYLINYYLARLLTADWRQSNQARSVLAGIFTCCFIFSTFVQVVGAFSTPHQWDISPTSHLTRFWDWQDSQIERHARNLYLKLNPPIDRPLRYANQLQGKLKQLKIDDHQLSLPLQVEPLQRGLLQLRLKNIGKSRWYGYETGLVKGRTIVRVEFLDQAHQSVASTFPNQLFVAGSPDSGEIATASGVVLFPGKPGAYQMQLWLQANRLQQSTRTAPLLAQFQVIVQPPAVSFP